MSDDMVQSAKALVARLGRPVDPEVERSERMEQEGMKVAAKELMEAVESKDEDALLVSLRNFIKIARI